MKIDRAKHPAGGELHDQSVMLFGKYGGKPLGAIPAQYFHWLWWNGVMTEDSPMQRYIKRSLKSLKTEEPDLIWDEEAAYLFDADEEEPEF